MQTEGGTLFYAPMLLTWVLIAVLIALAPRLPTQDAKMIDATDPGPIDSIIPGVPPTFVEELKGRSGLKPLPVVDAYSNPEAAAKLFHENGLVIVKGALTDELLQKLKLKAAIVMEEILENDPRRLGTRGPLRYSFGGSSSTGGQLHHPEWAALVDVPAVTAVLDEIWGVGNYTCDTAGGDFCLSGAPGHQNLHADAWFPDCEKLEVPPRIAVNYLLDDQTPFNGPLRLVPGTHRKSMHSAPKVAQESEESILSTMSPLPAGSALIRDLRAWHGGTPNLATAHRLMPNAEYTAKYMFPSSHFDKSMPREIWKDLSERGRDLAKFIVADQGETLKTYVRYDIPPGGNSFTQRLFNGFELAPMFQKCQSALERAAIR